MYIKHNINSNLQEDTRRRKGENLRTSPLNLYNNLEL